MNKLKEMAKDTVLRFPGSISCMFVFCVLIIMNMHGAVSIFMRESALLICGAMLSFIVEIVLENLDKKKLKFRLIGYFAVYILLQIAYFCIKDWNFLFPIIGCMLSSLAALVFKSKKREKFELTVVNLFSNVILSGIFATVLFGGLEIILIELYWLFDFFHGVSIFENLFGDIIPFTYFLVFPVVFLKGVPKVGEKLQYPIFLEKILKFVVTPLWFIALIVFNAFCVKNLYTDVTYLVDRPFVGYSMLFLKSFIFLLILITPFKDKFSSLIRKWGVFFIVPVVLVMFYVVYHGVTCEPKSSVSGAFAYKAIMAGIVSLISLVLIKVKDSKYQYLIFLVLALASFIAGFGPLRIKNVEGFLHCCEF